MCLCWTFHTKPKSFTTKFNSSKINLAVCAGLFFWMKGKGASLYRPRLLCDPWESLGDTLQQLKPAHIIANKIRARFLFLCAFSVSQTNLCAYTRLDVVADAACVICSTIITQTDACECVWTRKGRTPREEEREWGGKQSCIQGFFDVVGAQAILLSSDARRDRKGSV